MDEFSYLSVLVSIILGLAITQILKGFRGLVQSRQRLRNYAPTIVWAFVLLVMNVQAWWAMFGLRNHHGWTFFGFSVVLLQTALQYMLAALVLPDFFGEAAVDLRAHYYSHTRWFFGLAVALTLTSLGKDLVLDGHLPEPENVAAHAVFILTATIAAMTSKDWYHRALAPFTAVLTAIYIGALFARLQ